MVGIGWICLEYPPNFPFLWRMNGRGYAPFFLGTLLAEFQIRVDEKHRRSLSAALGLFVVLFFIHHTAVGFEKVFGSFGTMAYVRYFEFVAAPSLILMALNLQPMALIFSWKPLLWLGTLSPIIYYIHNCLMEDCLILNHLAGEPVNLVTWPVLLLILIGIIPAAMLYRKIANICSQRLRPLMSD